MKVVVLEPLKCTGCRACEYACSFVHTGLFNPLDSRIKINTFLEDLSFIPSICMQCEEPYCMEVCPTGALTKNAETGVVEFERNRCIGCKQCIIACPWGSIKLNHSGREIIKCDYCGGDPECVKVCAAKALTFEEVEDIVITKQKGVAIRYKEIAKEMARGVNP